MGFLIPAGTNSGTSPDEITRKRQLAQALLGDALKPEEMRSPLQGVGDLGEAFVSALLNRRANSQERTGKEGANSLIAQILSGNQASPAPAPMAATPGDPVNARINQGFDVAGEQPSGGMTSAQNAIAGIESKGSGDYSALGPVTKTGDRAYGKYQVMGANIPQWTKEILGQEMDPQAFLASPEAQDAVFKGKFGQYQQQTGSPSDAASMWFTGRPQAQGGNAQDQLGTSGNEYVAKFLAGGGAGNGGQSAETPANAGVSGGADNGALIAALLGNEYIDPAVKSLLFSKLSPEQKPLMDIGAGATVFDPNTRQSVFTAPGSSGTTVNVGDNGVKFPPPEAGYDYIRNPDGTVKVGENGLPTLAAIPGGKPATEAAAAQEKTDLGQQSKEKYADVVTQDIDRAVSGIEKYPSTTSGFPAQMLSGVGGTASHNVSELISGVKANVTFDRLQEMRAASPTGGALGQVSDFENKLMSSTLGSLEQSQSKDQLLFNLKRVRTIYDKIINEGIKPGDPILTETDAQQQQGGPQPGTVDGGYRFKGGDPADPKNWEPVS